MGLERDRWRGQVGGCPVFRRKVTVEAALEYRLNEGITTAELAAGFVAVQREMRRALGGVVKTLKLDGEFEVWGTGNDVPVFPVYWHGDVYGKPSSLHDRLDGLRVNTRLDGPFFDSTGRAFLTRLEGSFRRSPGHDELIAGHLPRCPLPGQDTG